MTSEFTAHFNPVQAIIVYKTEATNLDKFYLESHEIRDGKLLSGQPLREETLRDLSKSIQKDSRQVLTSASLLPSALLYMDQNIEKGIYLWYEKPKRQQLYFASSLGLASGEACCPTVLYLLKAGCLSVFSCKDKIIKPTSKIYKAPFHNVYSSGQVCLGNAKIESSFQDLEHLIEHWTGLFWKTEFSAILDESPVKSNLNLLWKRLVETSESFPLHELQKHPVRTIENLLSTFA